MRKLFTAASLIGLIVVTLASMAMAETGWGAGEVASAGDQVMTAAEMPAGGSMPAGEELCCTLKMPCTCEITCVNLSIKCCGCDGDSVDPIVVEFFTKDWVLLGTAKLGGEWCTCCGSNSHTASLDKPVNPQDVCHVRFSKGGDDNLEWSSLKLKVGTDTCCKMKWWTVLKCKFCCAPLGGDKAYYASGWCCN
ncbi:hypothetical protein IT575_13770 [bacterium]|nr:hypothetical protein [bacterium]